jgi:hypothetical protein
MTITAHDDLSACSKRQCSKCTSHHLLRMRSAAPVHSIWNAGVIQRSIQHSKCWKAGREALRCCSASHTRHYRPLRMLALQLLATVHAQWLTVAA